MKLIAAVVPMLFLAACIATTENYKTVLNTWVGVHVDRLVSAWGPPQSSFDLSSGGRVLQYSESRNARIGGTTYTQPQSTYSTGSVSAHGTGGSAYGTYSGTTTTYVQKRTPVYNVTMACTTRFTIGPDDRVSTWSFEGNNCKSLPPE
jgi:hypothetical protein